MGIEIKHTRSGYVEPPPDSPKARELARERLKAEQRREKIVDELCSYILKHNGPDSKGGAHPAMKQVKIHNLEEALERAYEKGLDKNVRTFHFANVQGLYTDTMSDYLLVRKFDYMLQHTYQGNLGKLIAEIDLPELRKPYQDTISKGIVPVNFARVVDIQSNNIEKCVRRYITLKGLQDELKDLRSYHFKKSSRGTFDSQQAIDELIEKKIDGLLKDKYENDLVALIQNTTSTEITEPFQDLIDGHQIEVSVLQAFGKYQESTYEIVQRYIQIKGREEEFKNLNYFHFKHPKRRSATKKHAEALLVRTVDGLLVDEYEGDIIKLIENTTGAEIRRPPVDIVAGQPIEISTSAIQKHFNGSTFLMIKSYLELKELKQEATQLKGYHLSHASRGTFTDNVIDDLVCFKIDQLLAQVYKGDFQELLRNTSGDELFAPAVDKIGNREIRIHMSEVKRKCRGSPLLMCKRYLVAKGRVVEAEKLSVGHLKRIPTLAHRNDKDVDDLIEQKIDSLLKTKRYQGSLVNLIQNVMGEELYAPITDEDDLTKPYISISIVGAATEHSPLKVFQRYIKRKGLEAEYSGLRGYHLKVAASGTFQKQEVIDELLTKKIKHLLDTRFDGDLLAFAQNTIVHELFSPLEDTLAGEKVKIKLTQLQHHFRHSLWGALQHYLTITGRAEEFKDLRPYHLGQAVRHTFKNEEICTDLLVKKLDALKDQEFGGDVFEMITSITGDHIRTPLIDSVAGQPVVISMGRVMMFFHNNTLEMVKGYLKAKGLSEEYKNLRSFHLHHASRGTFEDITTNDELLVRKIDQVRDTFFGGDFKSMLAGIRKEHVVSPLQDELAGRAIEVNITNLRDRFEASIYKMLRHYSYLKRIPFPYSPACFMGKSEEVRRRRIDGNLNSYDLRIVKAADGFPRTEHFGFKQYSAPDKDIVRELLLEHTASFLKDSPIRYLGLESERFESLRKLNELLNFEPSGSVVVERDDRVFSAMKSIQRNATHIFPELLEVDIRNNDLEKEIPQLNGKYNFVNLDSLGHLSRGKIEVLEQLIELDKLEDSAVLAVTLANRAIDQARAEAQGFGKDQVSSLKEQLESKCKGKFKIVTSTDLNYKGGTNGNENTDMVVVYIELKRHIPEQLAA